MESNFSLFRTSLHPSLYNNDSQFNRKENIGLLNEQNMKGFAVSPQIKIQPICMTFHNQNQPPPVRVIIEPKYNRYIQEDVRPKIQTIANAKISILKKNDSSQNIGKSMKKKISFNDFNSIDYINNKSYYAENNIKGSVWWTASEIESFKHMVVIEAIKLQKTFPFLSVQQCIKEVCNKS